MTDSTLPVLSDSVPTAPLLHNHTGTNTIPHPHSHLLTNPRHSTTTAPAHPLPPTFSPRGGADRFLSLASLARERTFAFSHRATSSSDLRPIFNNSTAATPTDLRAAIHHPFRHRYTRSADQTAGNKTKSAAIESIGSHGELARLSKLYEQPVPVPKLPSTSTSHPSSTTNKMHQTSSRLLRMTEDDRPFTKVRGHHTSYM